MKITQISIRNILGIREIEIKPGSETVLEGPNGAGKTSILNAIRAAFGFGHDATLLRKGEKKGEIVLIMDDGTEVSKTITETKSDSKVTLPEAGRVSASKRFIDSLLDRFALNPVDFLTAPAKYRAELLLESMPLTLTVEQVNECLPTNFHLESLNGKHPLEVIAATVKTIYDERTGMNRVAKTATAAVEETRKALPVEAEGGDWENLLKDEQDKLEGWQEAFDGGLGDIKEAALKQLKKEEDVYRKRYADEQGAVAEAMRGVEERIASLQREAQAINSQAVSSLSVLKTDWSERQRIIASETEQLIEAVRERELPIRDVIKTTITELEAKRDVYIRAQSLRDLITLREQEALRNEAAANILTASLDSLAVLKDSLVTALPIQGIEIRDGEVFVFEPSVDDFIPFDRANDARRVRIAIEIAKLRAKASKVPLIMVDRMQELDPNQFALFEKEIEAARKEGFQFIIARATGDEALTVRTR